MQIMLFVFPIFFCLIFTRIIYLLWIRRNPPFVLTSRNSRKYQVLAVLGSGGHTTEMLRLLTPLRHKRDALDLSFVVAESDHTSVSRIPSILGEDFPVSMKILHTKRIRNVGESVLAALLRIPETFFSSIAVLFKTSPDIILVNGPGTCIPLVFASLMMQILCLSSPVVIVFAESFCRTTTLSLTGKILYPFVDLFVLQWPPTDYMKVRYPRAKYLGVLL